MAFGALQSRIGRVSVGLIIKNIAVPTLYHETHALLSRTKLQISDKYRSKHVGINITHKASKDSNKFVFEFAGTKYIVVESIRINLHLACSRIR